MQTSEIQVRVQTMEGVNIDSLTLLDCPIAGLEPGVGVGLFKWTTKGSSVSEPYNAAYDGCGGFDTQNPKGTDTYWGVGKLI